MNRISKSFAATLCLFSATAGARPLAEIQASKVANLAAEGTLVPFNYHENSVLTGFEVELANHLFSKLGVQTKWQTHSFQSLLVGLGGNRYDAVVASLAITPERKEAVLFVDPHYCSGPVLVTKKKGLTSLSTLKDHRAAAKEGTIYFKFLAEQKGLKEIKSLPNNSDLIQALLSGRVDAIVLNEFAAERMLKAHPKANLVIGEKLMREELGIAVNKKDADLQKALNRELASALADGTYHALSMKYFGRDIRCQ
ncbi:MAG TPA: transporter substrate-binding domain-containing protein [Bdellovibrionota bacterium]|jgi:polar amino acid transport system substrate-binding protein|nr:transporter substrate-binding domain-containing protein [Bdellovibrionota bacterium]